MAPTVLIAPDSFKGTFSASQVAEAAAEGVRQAGANADLCPVADGGEGTMEILIAALGGTISRAPAHDPLGRAITARIGWLADGDAAIVETAEASGLALVAAEERDAERASTFGTGELIAHAAQAGAAEVIIAVGGSATSDGGQGAVEAIEQAGGLGSARLVVLCDVTTSFENAAKRFAPQKGADAEAVVRLTARLNAQALALPRDPRGVPMTGAAGGLSGGLWAAFRARLAPGAAWVLEAVQLEHRLAAADATIVGEGQIDSQSLEGKIVGAIAARCKAARVPVHAIVGSRDLSDEHAAEVGLASVQVATDLAAVRSAARQVVATITEDLRTRCGDACCEPQGADQAERPRAEAGQAAARAQLD